MTRFLLVASLSFILACVAVAGTSAEKDKKPVPSEEKPAVAEPLHRDGFFTFATRMINSKNIDYGELIAERRNTLADASATNSYFWYSAGSTATVLILLFVLYFKLLEYQDYQWRAAEVITDLRNSEKLATAKTRQAVASYKRHMVQCNRVVEAEVAGRVLPGAAAAQDMERAAESVRQKLQAAEVENRRLAEQLKNKEDLVKDLTSRLDALEDGQPIPAREAANTEKSDPELLALVNRLTRDLDFEKRRNGVLKGA